MKNKIIKLFSILVCISMILSLISPAAFAAEYENDGIYVEINAPEDGKKFDFRTYVSIANRERYGVSNYNGECYINGIRICDVNVGRYLTEDDIISHEHDYKVDVMIEPKEGYGFADYQGKPNLNAYMISYELGGRIKRQANVAWESSKKDKIEISYVYNVRRVESIDYVSVNVTPPEQGEYPSYDCEFLTDYIDSNYSFDDGEYCINGMTWHQAQSTWDPLFLGQKLSKDNVFEGGNTYRLTMQIVAELNLANDLERKFGFDFAPQTLCNKLLVNGDDSRGRTTPSSPEMNVDSESCYIIYKDFYCPRKKTVTDVALEVDSPMLDHHPDFDVAFATDGYRPVQNPPEDGFINGIKWRDLTAQKNLTQQDTFEEGHRYSFSTYLEPIDENTALAVDSYGNTTVSGTMNSNDAIVTSGMLIYGSDPKANDSYAISYDYIFETVSNQVTRIAILNLEEPVAGEAPDYTASVKNNKVYDFDTSADDMEVTTNGIYWKNITTNEVMDDTAIFEAGNQYSVFIKININDGYTLGQTVSSVINGKECQTYVIGDALTLVYTFDEVELLKAENNMAVGITTPVEGEYPYYDITVKNIHSFITDVRWKDNSNSMDGAYITEDDAFVGGHQYQLELDLVPQDNYEFLTDEDGNVAFEFIFEVDGVEYAGTVEGTANEITATYNFVPLLISSIDISIDEPAPGFAPSFLAYASNDACYINELKWYDKTADVYITEGDDYVFEENHVYVLTVDVITVGDRCFDAYSDKFSATVNGKISDIDNVYYEIEGSEAILFYSQFVAQRLTYDFGPCVMDNILTAECDRYTGSVTVNHEIYSLFEEDAIALYLAFYNNEGAIISCAVKDVQWQNDIYSEQAPDDAAYCKAMLWNKNTLKPLCNAAGCEVVKEV